jgi:4-amino-4-deoxy-L-arabinose transferase-like glycosyltransferase
MSTHVNSEIEHTVPIEHERWSLRASWRWWIGPALLSVAFALFYLDPFIGDWDAIDYTVLAIKGLPSSMALGRTVFIFFNHALWLIAHTVFQVPASNAYLLFQYSVVLQTPLAVIACWYLARQVSGSVETATLASLLIATSPAFVVYSGQAMTEIPSMLILGIALSVHLRGLRERRTWLVFAGAVLLGVGVNVRETVGFYAPWLILGPFFCGWRLNLRDVMTTILAGLIFSVVAFSGFGFWFLTDTWNYRAAWHGWRVSMAMESARHPFALRNVWSFIAFFFLSSPFIA